MGEKLKVESDRFAQLEDILLAAEGQYGLRKLKIIHKFFRLVNSQRNENFTRELGLMALIF